MEDAPDFEGIRDVDKEKPVVGDAKPEFVPPLKRFHIALAGVDEAIKCGKNTHGGLAVDAAYIGLGRVGPDDPLHLGSVQLSISSCVMPSSAKTCSWGMASWCFSHSRDSSSALISSTVGGSSS